MGTSNSLSAAAAKLDRALTGQTTAAMAKAGGMAAKKEALRAASASLGGDRRFSNFKRIGTLNAGFDMTGGTSVTVNYRPAAAWRLAEEGRKGGKTVRKRGVIFRTPNGPRRAFRSGRSRGLHTLTDAQQGAAREAPKAAFKAMQGELGKVF